MPIYQYNIILPLRPPTPPHVKQLLEWPSAVLILLNVNGSEQIACYLISPLSGILLHICKYICRFQGL